MKDRYHAGAISGLVAGLIMGFFVWLGFQSGLVNFSPFYILSSVFLPDELAVGRVGTLTAMLVHLLISTVIGLIFSFFVAEKKTLFWGAGLGVFLHFFFGAVVTPAFTDLAPFWDMDIMNMTYTFMQRLVFGFSLGYLYGLWFARQAETGNAVR